MTELLSTEELADWLGVPVATVYVWRAKGEAPPAYRIGKHLRWPREGVESWLAEHSEAPAVPA